MSNDITEITLDERVKYNRTPEIEYEYNTALSDLLANNRFILVGKSAQLPPYEVHLRIAESRLVMEVKPTEEKNDPEITTVILPSKPFRSIIKDYFIICENYYSALHNKTASQLEAIDMARRGLHNEGAELLKDVISTQVDVSFDTARQLFSLICILHVR